MEALNDFIAGWFGGKFNKLHVLSSSSFDICLVIILGFRLLFIYLYIFWFKGDINTVDIKATLQTVRCSEPRLFSSFLLTHAEFSQIFACQSRRLVD